MSDYQWTVQLTPNLLTPDVPNDYVAQLLSPGATLHNEQLADKLVAARTELRRETILSVLAARDRLVCEALLQGFSVQDGVLHVSPRIHGAWTGEMHHFDPAAHTLSVNAAPSAELRKALGGVGVNVVGMKDSGAYIGLVTDLSTGKANGTVHKGEDIAVEGDKIKLFPDGDSGVFFVDSEGEPTPVEGLPALNTPKKLIVRVPGGLGAGPYRLQVVTRFTSGTQVLKEPRTIEYAQPLSVAS